MSLDTLAELVQKTKPCSCACHEPAGPLNVWQTSLRVHLETCDDNCTSTVLVWPELHEALWEKCPNTYATSKYQRGKGLTIQALRAKERYCASGQDDCRGTGFVRSSRVEAAMALWSAAKPMMRKEGWFFVPVEDGWEIWRSFREWPGFRAVTRWYVSPEDTLAAAVEAALRAEVEKKP